MIVHRKALGLGLSPRVRGRPASPAHRWAVQSRAGLSARRWPVPRAKIPRKSCGVLIWIESLCLWGFCGTARRVRILAHGGEFPALVCTRARWPAGIEVHLAAELGAVGGSGLLGVSFQSGCLTSTTKGPAPQGDPLRPFGAGSVFLCKIFSQVLESLLFVQSLAQIMFVVLFFADLSKSRCLLDLRWIRSGGSTSVESYGNPS